MRTLLIIAGLIGILYLIIVAQGRQLAGLRQAHTEAQAQLAQAQAVAAQAEAQKAQAEAQAERARALQAQATAQAERARAYADMVRSILAETPTVFLGISNLLLLAGSLLLLARRG